MERTGMRLFGTLMLVVAVAQFGSDVAAAPAKVVDMSVAAKQPNLKVVENKIKEMTPSLSRQVPTSHNEDESQC